MVLYRHESWRAIAVFGCGALIAIAVSGCQPASTTSGSQSSQPTSVAAPNSTTTLAAVPDPSITIAATSAAIATTPVAAKPTVIATHSVAPKPAVAPSTTASRKATAAPPKVSKPAPVSLCGAPANPWGYNFCGRGGLITAPAADVCSYFNCIANFPNGKGYMEECQDATFSRSGGRSGSCSDHGGNLRPVYSGP
jgi:hypothetical protein